MERVQDSDRVSVAGNILSSWKAITNGVVAKTTSDRQKYWRHWCRYTALFKYDPFLSTAPPTDKDCIICAFGANVRTGVYGRGAQVKVQTVTDALSAISTTIQLASQRSPVYREDQKYTLAIERMVEGFRREDPPSIPQLAVPVIVPNACYEASMKTSNIKLRHTGSLVIIAFYYLLRVGEYTKPRTVQRNGKAIRATRTKQFSVGNVGFFKAGKIVPRTSSLKELLSCDSATLKITNQKNGRMGDTVHQKTTGLDNCPIKALANIVHHILSHGGTNERLLCEYCIDDSWYSLVSGDIVLCVRSTAKVLRLDKQGIDPDLIGAHSLRAGGAMALRLHGYEDTVIMKMGRWTSLTFLQYIHTQIAHLAEDISKKMSIPLPFLNIASIEGH